MELHPVLAGIKGETTGRMRLFATLFQQKTNGRGFQGAARPLIAAGVVLLVGVLGRITRFARQDLTEKGVAQTQRFVSR
jgi:hypothetical protein